jgi:hypothetical protein
MDEQNKLPNPGLVIKQLPDFGALASKVASSPAYQTLKPPVADQTVQPSEGEIQPGSATEKLAALNKGLYGSLPFGIGDWILKKTQPKQYAEMEQAAKANPGWNTAGSLAGGASQALIQPAIGAGKGVASILGRAALNTLPQAAITAGTQAAEGDVAGAAKGFGTNMLLGTAIGSAFNGVANKIPEVLDVVKQWGQRRGIRSAGIISADLLKALKSGPLGKYRGSVINNADDEVNALWTVLKKTGSLGRKAQEKLFGEQGEVWSQLAKGYDDAALKPIDDTMSAGIMSSPRIKSLLGRTDYGTPEELTQYITDTMSGISSGAGYRGQKQVADDIIKRGFQRGVDTPTLVKGLAAQIVKDEISEAAGALSPTINVAGLKKTWHDIQPMIYALEREAKGIGGADANSATAARLFAQRMLLGGAEGGALGGIGGLAATGAVDPNDPDRWKKILASSIGGVALGGIANKIIPRVVNKVGGRMIGRASDIITPGMASGLSQAAGAVGPVLSKMAGMGEAGPVVGAAENVAQASVMQPISEMGGAPAGAQPIANAPAGQPAPTLAQNVPTPQETGQAKFENPTAEKAGPSQFDPSKVEDRMQVLYQNYARKYGTTYYTYEKFKNEVLKGTEGLSPDNMDSWNVLYANPTKAAKMYADHMALSRIPMDEPVDTFTADAMNHYTRIFSGSMAGQRLTPAQTKREQLANQTLVDTLHTLTGKTPGEIDRKLHDIAFMRDVTPEQKKQMVMDIITKEGHVDIGEMQRIGLWR